MSLRNHHFRILLEEIEAGNGRSQRYLATKLGIALGLTNLLLKQVIGLGWIRMVQVKPNRVEYLITPAGVAQKAQMSRDYLVYSARFYASARERLQEVLSAVAEQWTGPEPCRVAFLGAGEIAEIGFVCLQATSLRLVAVVDDRRDALFFGLPVHRPTDLQGLSVGGVPFDRLMVMVLDDLDVVEASLARAAVAQESVFWLRDWRWSNTGVVQQPIGPSRGAEGYVRASASTGRPVRAAVGRGATAARTSRG